MKCFVISFCLFLILVTSKVFSLNVVKVIDDDWWPLTILHMNDIHARFDEMNLSANSCDSEKEVCIGGLARMITKVKEMKEIKKDLHPIYLNAGDNFQGTLWYNIGRWNVTSQLLNLHPADVQTIGNHDFDHDIEGVVPYLERTRTLTPTVIANVDDTDEPTIQGKYQSSYVIEKYDRKIGVIGAILRTTNNIAKTGKLRFSNEADAVRAEATRLKNEGVNIIVVLTHCGLDRDKEIARLGGPDIDIIVGGHSHSFLFSGDDLPSLDRPADNYPVVITQADGHEVLIVQASAYTKYLGDITLYFDDEGIIRHYEGEPHFISSDIVPDPEVHAAIQPWKVQIDAEGQKIVGNIKYDAHSRNCYSNECPMGTIQAESMLYSIMDWPHEDNAWTYASMAFSNPGGVRGSLNKGDLSFSNLVTTTPFENSVEVFEIQGKFIREMLENAVSNPSSLYIMPSAGVKVVYKLSNPRNQRAVSIDVLCRICDVPKYEPLQNEEVYRVVVNGYLLQAGDTYAMLRDNLVNKQIVGVDIDALKKYVEKHSPISFVVPFLPRVTFI